MRYRIDGGDGRLVAEARTVLVAYDYTAGATIPVPEELKARVLAFQRGWQFAG
jgi:acyl-CoA thioester hydrolase